ncbi:MAG: hypothetical protein WBA31_03120 [Candidatus Dormiibacterota bacterium]
MISDNTAATGTLRRGGQAHPPEQIARIPLVGTWLLIGSTFFFVLPLFFAFFFLQQANMNHMWEPKGIHPPNLALGTVAMALAVAGILLAQSGLRNLKAQATLALFANVGRAAALLMAAAVVVQIWQLSHVGYGIDSGAYASCFFAMQTVMTIMIAALALWVLSLANRSGYEALHPIAMPAVDSPEEVATPISALSASYEMFALFLGAVVVLAWVVCYFL